MSIFKNNLLDFGEDIVLPFTNEWKKTYAYAIKKIEEHNKNCEKLKFQLNQILNVVIKVGEAYEDIVLKATMLYFLAKNKLVSVSELQQSYSPLLVGNIQVLLNDLNSTALDEVFLNKEYAYLNKIKLAELIVLLHDAQNNQIVNKIKLLTQVDAIIKKYKNKTHKKLMALLIETRNKTN